MNKRQAGILNLHYDILKEIMIRVARSSDGANNFANSLSVCKPFRQFVEDEDVLKAVDFDDLLISNRWELFQLKQGLIYRCALAGNAEAQFILAKIILMSTSQLLRATRMETTDLNPSSYGTASLAKGKLDKLLMKQNPQLIRFMRNFFPNKNNLNTPGLHSNLVRIFLTRARFVEYKEMQPYMHDYIEYFLGRRGHNPDQFLLLFNAFCSSTAEKRLERFQAKFAKETTEMCLCAIHCMESIGLKEAELRLRELVVAEEEHGGFTMATLVEKFDVTIKRFRTLRAVVEEEIGKAFNSSGDKEGFAGCLFFWMKCNEVAFSIENGALESKVTALFYEDQRVNLVCKFDVLFCQLMTNDSSE